MYSLWASRPGAVHDFDCPAAARARTKGSATHQRESRKGPRAIRSGTSTRAFCTEVVRGSRRTARDCRGKGTGRTPGRETLAGRETSARSAICGECGLFRQQLLGHLELNLRHYRDASTKLSGRARGWLHAVLCPETVRPDSCGCDLKPDGEIWRCTPKPRLIQAIRGRLANALGGLEIFDPRSNRSQSRGEIDNSSLRVRLPCRPG